MKGATLVSVEEYLRTSFRPDREYIEARVLERNVGERDHSRVQTLLVGYLLNREKQWAIRVFAEQRVQVKPGRFRVPDVCVLAADAPQEQIFTQPPLLSIEILSKDDRMSEMQERISDYLSFGVPCVWIVDPRTKRAWAHTAAGAQEAKDGMLRCAPQIVVPLAEIFAELP